MRKYNVTEFANDIRAKHPGSYDDLSDEKLVELWLKKFPNDEEKIIFESYEEDSGAPKKSNKWKFFLAVLLLILFVLLRSLITSGELKDSDFIDKNELKTDYGKVELKYGVVSNSAFDELYLFEKKPVLESDGEPSYENNLSNNGIYFELCHWTKNTESLNIENTDLLNDFPTGEYTYNGKSEGNWQPYTITDISYSTPNFSSDTSKHEIIWGTLNISKNNDEYTIDFEFKYDNGEVTSGHFKGPLSRFD